MGNMWSESEDDLINAQYCGSGQEALSCVLPGRTWRAIRQRAYTLKSGKRKGGGTCGAELSKLLEDTPEALYWLGFLLAEGAMLDLDDIEDVDRLLNSMMWRMKPQWQEAPQEWGRICLEDFRRQDEALNRQCRAMQRKGVDD